MKNNKKYKNLNIWKVKDKKTFILLTNQNLKKVCNIELVSSNCFFDQLPHRELS